MIDLALSLCMCHQICNMCVCLVFFLCFFLLGGGGGGGEGGGLWPALCPIPSELWLRLDCGGFGPFCSTYANM